MKKGFTLIETIVGAAVFLVVAVTVYGAYTSIFQLANLNQARVLATNLVDEQFEIIHNMPYLDVGIVGGDPNGVLPATTTVIRGGIEFNVGYFVWKSSLLDNKSVQISVSCPSCKNFNPINIVGQITPNGTK